MIEEVAVDGVDLDDEPVTGKWFTGTLWIGVETMAPFFAENAGLENEFNAFELAMQDAPGVAVRCDDRELLTIKQPQLGRGDKVKAWLGAVRENGAR